MAWLSGSALRAAIFNTLWCLHLLHLALQHLLTASTLRTHLQHLMLLTFRGPCPTASSGSIHCIACSVAMYLKRVCLTHQVIKLQVVGGVTQCGHTKCRPWQPEEASHMQHHGLLQTSCSRLSPPPVCCLNACLAALGSSSETCVAQFHESRHVQHVSNSFSPTHVSDEESQSDTC